MTTDELTQSRCPDACAQPFAMTLPRAFTIGAALGTLGVFLRVWFYPYRVFVRRTGTRP